MGYLAILLLAAVWAVVERTRSALAERTREPAQVATPFGLDVAAAESMTARELEAEREAAQLLLGA